MTTHRRYTKREKVTAVIAADMTSTLAAAEQSGIPESTIRYWLDDPEFADLRDNAREAMSEEAAVVARLGWRLLGRRMPNLEDRDLVVATGMATDKALLMSGHATERTEVRDITDDLGDDEKRRLAEWARGLPADTAGEAAGVAEAPAVAHTGAEEPATA